MHWDGDAFFASVEQAADKRLRGLPVAVGGERRGIIASASYEARRYGIHSAMPTAQARRLCPDLILVRGRFELYEEFSDNIFGLCETVTPYVERSSIDEGYLDCTPLADCEQVVRRSRELMDEVYRWLKVTISGGVASNRLVSAVASKLRKPRGFIVVPKGSEQNFFSPLSVSVLPGIGPKTLPLLNELGLQTLGELSRFSPDHLAAVFGRQTASVLSRARGEDDSPVKVTPAAAKSHSHQETFDEDVEDRVWLSTHLKVMMEKLLKTLRSESVMARTLTVGLRYTDWEETSGQVSLTEPSDLAEDFFRHVGPLVGKLWNRRVRIRQASVRLSHLYPAFHQQDLFDSQRDQRRTLAQVSDVLQSKYGSQALRRGIFLDESSRVK